jgi:hypothetical protein
MFYLVNPNNEKFFFVTTLNLFVDIGAPLSGKSRTALSFAMDPVTIITSVSAISKAAVGISTTLSTFIDATQNVDQSIQAIYDGITALNRTLNAIRSTLESSHVAIGASSTQEQDSGLWAAVVEALDDCRVTVEKFKASLTGLEHKGSNDAVQALRAFKLQHREEELKTFRAQVQTHNTALQLVLQMINM